MVPNEITHEIVVDAPVDRVWAIITEPEHIQAWFAFDGATIDLRPGGELVMTWKEHGTYHARIERIEPPHSFAWRWARLPGLRVVESGFRDLDLPEAEKSQWAADNTQGWQGGFDALQTHAVGVAA